jgi:hypothetical protein
MGKVRRIIKAGLWSFAAILAFLVLIFAGLFAYAAIDKQDSFVLQSSEFDKPDYFRQIAALTSEERRSRQPEEVPVYAHRLKRGSGTILAFRFYSSGAVTTIDDEDYRKITVWIAGGPPQSAIDLPLADASKCLLVLSRGGSAWPHSECSGYGTSGTVRVEPRGGRFKITIDGEITPVVNLSAWCRAEKISLTFQAKEIAFENLTPWLGIAGRHPYEETYR